MKVNFENGVSSYSGKYDEVVYSTWFNNRLCYARKYAYPALGLVHENMRQIGVNLNSLYLAADAAYIADLKAYAKLNARENLPRAKKFLHKMPSSKSLFLKMMWAWHMSDPTHIDLKTVTLADITLLDSPARAVSKAVDAGYLKKVTGYAAMTNEISGE